VKIARIQTTPPALALKEPYQWDGRVDLAAAVVLVEVETESPGIAIEDLAAAHHVYAKAEESGAAAWIEIGGLHFGSSQDLGGGE
jgi:hypothetical protein